MTATSTTCPECNRAIDGGMHKHRGSRRCEVDTAVRKREESGWVRAGNLARTLRAAGVEVEEDYTGWYPQYRKRDELSYANWAPGWAVEYAEALRDFGFGADDKRRLIADAARLKRPWRRAETVIAQIKRNEATTALLASLPPREKRRLAHSLVRRRKCPEDIEASLREMTVLYELGGTETALAAVGGGS